MAGEGGFSKFQQEFMRRTKEARESVRPRISQARMGKLLGDLPQGTYKHYEVDRLLPHEYVELFCALTGRTPNWLFTGEEMAEAAPRQPVVRQVYPPTRKRK